MRNPAAVTVLSLIAAAVHGGVSGCRERADSIPVSAEPDVPPAGVIGVPSGDPAGARVPLEAIGLVEPDRHLEPPPGAWRGEAFQELATARLKAVVGFIGDLGSLDDAALVDSMIAPSFQCGPLVPSEIETIVDDPVLVVRRAAVTAGADRRDAFRGPDGFCRAMALLAAAFEESDDVRAEIKIVDVDVDIQAGAVEGPSTEALVEVWGRVAEGVLSRRFTWQCTWERPGETADPRPRLVAIVLSGFGESLGRTAPDGTRLFEEATPSVFAGVESFESQLNRGIDHWAARIESRHGIGLEGWHGLALGDADGDGLDDLYVCEPGGLPNRLYLRRPDGTVRDASRESGADFLLRTQSALFVDLDNDGDQDLVLATAPGILVLGNDGHGGFSPMAAKTLPDSAPMCLAAADYDLDGDLDIHAGCYAPRRSEAPDVPVLGRPIPYHDAANGGRNVLLRNDRGWRFTDVTREVGLDAGHHRFTLAAAWEDVDGDADPDLYVANDYGRNNLYRNDLDADGRAVFVDVAAAAGVEDLSAGMSVAWGDPDQDGDRDLYVSNMWSSAGHRIAFQPNFQPDASDEARAGFRRHARGNSLFLNDGAGTFRDATKASGAGMGRWAWGSRFADLDLDGREDLVVANGFVTRPEDTGDL